MSHNPLAPYADVVVVNSNRVALELSLNLKKEPHQAQRNTFGGSEKAGYFYLYRHGSHPDSVYECITSAEHGDAIAGVYKNHRIFASRGELIHAREQLIRAIAGKIGISAESIGIDDPGRGRTLGLVELSTGQLIDVLADRMGKSIVVTASHSAVEVAR